MTKHETNIFLFTFLILGWALTGCSDSNHKTTPLKNIDTTIIQPTESPKKDSTISIKKESITIHNTNTKANNTKK